MGGTTAKLGAVDGGKPAIMPTFEVDLVRYKKGSGLPINVPAVEMIEIGAGGGSIARNDKGMIVVGPDSAGADPGPICYGRGGEEPTITDANVVLGYIAPDWFNARRHASRRGGCRRRHQAGDRRPARHIGGRGRLGHPPGRHLQHGERAAHRLGRARTRPASLRHGGVRRRRTSARGALARAVGIPTVIVPYGAGVGSAIGLLEAEPRIDVTTTRIMRIDAATSSGEIAALYRDAGGAGAR